MADRRFVSVFDAVDNVTKVVNDLQRKLSDFSNKDYVASVGFESSTAGKALENIKTKVAETSGAATKAGGSLGKVGEAARGIGNAMAEAGNKSVSVFGEFQKAIEDTGTAVTKLVGSLALIGTGGAVAGLSYIGAAQEELYEKQLMKSMAANKKWGMSSAEDLKKVQDTITNARNLAYTSSDQMAASIQTAYTYGGKYAKGEKGLDIAQQAERVAFAYKPKPGEGDLSGDYLQRLIYRRGTLRQDQKGQLAMALGVSIDDKSLDTVKGRIKLLEKQSGTIVIETEIKEQPWKVARLNIEKLKDQIGISMKGPMSTLINSFSSLVDTIMKIPGASALIGWVAILAAAAGAASLLIAVITPLVSFMSALRGIMFAQAAATAITTTANTALVASNLGVTASAYAMATGLWAALAPILLIAIPLIALGAILYMVETKTHIFSKALKELGKSQMARDLIGWFKDVGYWINQGIKWLDDLYKGFKASGQMKMVLDIMGMALMPLLKPMLMVADFLWKLVGGMDGLKKLFESGLTWWKKIAEILSWMFDKLVGIYYSISDWLHPKAEKPLLPGQLPPGPIERFMKWLAALAGIELPDLSKFEWPELPDFAWPTLPDFHWPTLPSTDNIFDGLKTAIQGLIDWVNGILKMIPGYSAPSGTGGGKPPALPEGEGGGETPAWANPETPEGKAFSDQLTAEAGVGGEVVSAQHGATFRQGGLFRGRVHSPEELVGQSQAIKGPGVLARSIDALDSLMSGRPMAAGAGASYSIQVANHNDFSDMKVSSDIDIEKLLTKIDKRIEAKSTEAVNKAIGNRGA